MTSVKPVKPTKAAAVMAAWLRFQDCSELYFEVLGSVHLNTVDKTDPGRMRLHDERRRPRAVAEEADAAHQRAVGDTGRREHDPLGGREVLRLVNPLEVGDPHRPAPLFVLRLAHYEPREDFTVEAAHRRRGEHAFGGAAGPHYRVDTGADDRRRNAGGQVAVANQPDTRARGSDLFNQLLVARPVEDADHQVADAASERLRNRTQVEADGCVQIDDLAGARAHDQLLHVYVGRVQEAAPFRGGQHGKRVGRAGRAQVRAFEWIDRDVHLRVGAAVPFVVREANLLADEQHRRLVALAFADDDGAVDRDGVHLAAHRFNSNLVRLVPIALSHRLGARDRRLLDDAEEVERQVQVHELAAGEICRPGIARTGRPRYCHCALPSDIKAQSQGT